MKAISLFPEDDAALIASTLSGGVIGLRRGWTTEHRGPVVLVRWYGPNGLAIKPHMATATAVVTDCRPIGNRWHAIVLTEAKPITARVPCEARAGLFEVPDSLLTGEIR